MTIWGQKNWKRIFLIVFGDARVSSQTVVVGGSEGCPVRHPDFQGHRAIPYSKGSRHLVRVTKGLPWLDGGGRVRADSKACEV